jgi:hypothetical protein
MLRIVRSGSLGELPGTGNGRTTFRANAHARATGRIVARLVLVAV